MALSGRPSFTHTSQSLHTWREDVLALTARIFFVLAVPLVGASFISALTLPIGWLTYFFDLGMFILLGLAAFATRLDFALRTRLLLSVIYLTATVWLITNGLVGAGRLYFLLLLVLGALLLNRLGLVLVSALILLTIGGVYGGFALALLPLPLEIVERMFLPWTLVNTWLVQLVLSAAVGAAVVLTVSRLQSSLAESQHIRDALQELNAQLEQRIAARTQELRFQAQVLDTVGEAVIATTPDGVITYWNQAAAALYGWLPAQALGQNVQQMTCAHLITSSYDEIMAHVRAGQSWAGEFVARRADGTAFAAWSTNVPLWDDAGQLVGIIGVSQDISERKQAETALRLSEVKYRTLVENAGVAIALYDNQGHILLFNEMAAQLLGGHSHDFVGQTLHTVFANDLADSYLVRIQDVIRTSQTAHIEEHILVPSGTHWFWSTTSPVRDATGQVVAAQVIAHDITQHKQTEHVLEQQVRQLEALRQTMQQITSELELAPLLQAILERATALANAAFGQIALYHIEQQELEILASHNVGSDLAGARLPLTEQTTGVVVHTQQPLLIHNYLTWHDRLPIHKDMDAHALLIVPLLAGNEVLGILIVGHNQLDATFTPGDTEVLTLFAQQAAVALHNARLFAEVNRLATTDYLTGLHNRHSFALRAQQAFEQASSNQQPLSVLMLDIDHFKQVNDRYGHLAGDQVLQSVAQCCSANLRAVDVIGRYGGEEIVMVLPETNLNQAQNVAERLRASLAQVPLQTDYGPIAIHVSVGIASCTDTQPLTLTQLIDQADQALYAAKQAGRNQVRIWGTYSWA